ncbi:MAG TPA: thioredoxin domain-containing protein [Solirubrobacterales bacterium]|nr:thioredoxin domain-containing protein [Solirubrobacterales bacterium]
MPRVLLGVGIAGLVAAIISLSVGTGGPKVIRISGGNDVQELLGGVQQDGSSLGTPDAPVTLGLFTDLQCSTCDTYQRDTVDPLIAKYARGDQVRFEFHNYSLGQADVTQSAYAATAAGNQDREWQFAELFFRNQDEAPAGNVTDQFLDDLGNSIPDFDLDAWHQAMDSDQVKEDVDADQKLAAQYGLRIEAPSIVVDGPDGTKVLQDGPTKQEVEAAVADVGGS